MMEQEESNPIPRYKPGVEFYYDFTYASGLRTSKILKGYYELPLSELLEDRQERLRSLQEDLEDHTTARNMTRQVNRNRGLKTREDDRSREKRVTMEARIDICSFEIIKLEQAIKEAEQEKEERELPPCLPQGPIGMNQVKGSTGKGFLDGMWCENVHGICVIVDERSPYRGLAVIDYIPHVVKPWHQACRNIFKEKIKVWEAGHRREEDRPTLRSCRVRKPPFPANCKNHLNGKATDLKRTKK